MRKTYDVLQVQTSLEKAERRLEEAIELAKRESTREESDMIAAQKAVEDAMSEFKKAAMEEQRATIEEQRNEDLASDNVAKPLYGYAPEFSRHRKIENDITEIDEDKKALLANILGDDVIHEHEHGLEIELHNKISSKDEEKIVSDINLFNEEFHEGYDSLNKIAAFNNALRVHDNQSAEDMILGESEDYEMKCFNDDNAFSSESHEVADIMPSSFFLDSFDCEEDVVVKPYDINEALILGDVIPSKNITENSEEIVEVPSEQIEKEQEVLEESQKKLLMQAQQEADEILEKARIEAQSIINNAQQEAQKIIDEKVDEAIAEASLKGYDEGFGKGENEGYLAAEDAVNEAMIQEAEKFRNELELAINDFNERKNEILRDNINELTDLSINIAEKVIKISLKSSKDVVAKMIVAAAEDCRNKEWAKIYISNEDKAIAMNLEKELIDALNQISSNVKVVVMEHEPSGTCIIESPDQIVDASVGTQLDNIRQTVSDNKI